MYLKKIGGNNSKMVTLFEQSIGRVWQPLSHVKKLEGRAFHMFQTLMHAILRLFLVQIS